MNKVSKRQKTPVRISLWERIPWGVYLLVVSLALLVVGIGVPTYLSQIHHAPQAASSFGVAAPLDIGAEGGPAPGFSLQDAHGQTYTLRPGDGRVHLLVFYMGYF